MPAASEDDLDDLVDEEQGDGKPNAEQPLVTAERGQAQSPLQEAQLRRQVDEQQGKAVAQDLVSIVEDIPVERCLGFTVAVNR